MARFIKNKKETIGTAPGTLVFIGKRNTIPTDISLLQYDKLSVQRYKLKTLTDITTRITDEKTTWINICGLQDTTIVGSLHKELNIPNLILEDFLNTDERPKISEDNFRLYIILKFFHFNPEEKKTTIEQLCIAVGKNFLITITESNNNHFIDVSNRIENGTGKIRTFGSDYLCYALIDTLVDSYIINLEKIGTAIEQLEKSILCGNRDSIQNIYHYKTELSFIRKNIRPSKEVITRLASGDSRLINEHSFSFLNDLQNLITQTLETIEIYYTMLSDQQNTFNTNISNNQSDVMKVLTIFSTIFIPLTFIASIFGMNFIYLPGIKSPHAILTLSIVMIIIVFFMIIFLKRRKWL